MMVLDGQPGRRELATDRGLLYGDGLFETVRWQAGRAPLWDRHCRRLAAGCDRIGLPTPDPSQLDHDCRQALDGRRDGVVRITLTRGDGPRGYAPPPAPRPRRIVTSGELPPARPPLRVISCETRPAESASLGGLKHLGRLDQVQAAREVHAGGADEGLLFRADGRLVEGVSGNAFLLLGDRWVTPPIVDAGVAGVFRDWLLERADGFLIAEIHRCALAGVRAAFLTNAVRGIEAIEAIDGRILEAAPVRAIQKRYGAPWSAGS